MSEKEKVNILLVDDQPAKLLSYEAVLGQLDENLLKAHSDRRHRTSPQDTSIAVVLVDVCMPDLDGFELAKMIREHPRIPGDRYYLYLGSALYGARLSSWI